MSQRRKKEAENEKCRKKVPTKTKKEDRNFTVHCSLCNEHDIVVPSYTSKKVKNKISLTLTKKSPSKNEKYENLKVEKTTVKNNRRRRNIGKPYLIPDAPSCSTSPALSDKTSDSDIIVISEADSGVSEKVSPSSYSSGSSPCNDYTPKLGDDKLPSSDITTESMPMYYKSKCNISVTLNENSINTNQSGEILPYESSFAATLPSLEVNYESDFSDLMESTKTQNTMMDNSHLSPDSNILNGNILFNRPQQITPEHYNSLHDITVPTYFSPKRNLLSLMNNINSVCDSKENFICNQLKIQPLIKPPDFNYEENDLVHFVADISVVRAAYNFVKEKSKSEITSASLPDICGSPWHSSIAKLSDPFLNLSGINFNQLSSEDNESEISISSCKTSDIQPEFFDLTFSENLENISENFTGENVSDYVTISSSPNANTNDLCSTSFNKEITNTVELLSSNNDKNLHEEAKPKVKRKRKRCIWDTKKRRCTKRKKKDTVSKSDSDLNAEYTALKINELNAEIYCDTCDESEVEEDETQFKFCNQNSLQEKEYSSEIGINHNSNQSILNNSEKNEVSCNQLVPVDAGQFQNTHQDEKSSYISNKLNCKENVKDLEDENSSMEELNNDSPEKNSSDSFNKLNNSLKSKFVTNCDQNVNILFKSLKSKKQDKNSYGNQKQNLTKSSEIDNPECEKDSLRENYIKDRKELKCSVGLNILSQSHEKYSKSNDVPQKQRRNSKSTAESTKIVSNKKTFNSIVNSNSSHVRLRSSKLNKSDIKQSINEIKTNKSNLKNVIKEHSKVTDVYDNFTVNQNSDLTSENSCLESNLTGDQTKNNYSLSNVKKNNVLTEGNALNINVNTEAHKEDCANTETFINVENNSEVSAIETSIKSTTALSEDLLDKNNSEHISSNVSDDVILSCNTPENILYPELQKNKHIVDNLEKTGNISASDLQENEHIHIDNLNESPKSAIQVNISKDKSYCHVNSDTSSPLNLNPRTTEDSNSVSNENTCYLEPEMNNNFDNSHGHFGLSPPRGDIFSNSLQEMNEKFIAKNYNVDSLSVKEHIDNQNSNKLKTNEYYEIKSPTNTETVLIGLTEDDLDFEPDPHDDLNNECSFDNNASFCKSPNDEQSWATQFFSKTNINFSSAYSNVNSDENLFSFSNDLPENSLQDANSSDDDSDSDKDYNFKRSHERRTNVFLEPLEDANVFEKTATNLPDQVHESYETLAKNLNETNMAPTVDTQTNCALEYNIPSNSPRKVITKSSQRLDDVVSQIKECCYNGMPMEAVQLADTYISISSTSEANKFLFKNLLYGLFSFTINSSSGDISLSNIFDEVLKLMQKFEIYDKKILSYFIIKCSEHSELKSCAKRIFDCCKEKKIPLSSDAINAFNSVLKLEELTLSVLLNYIDHIKSVCNKRIPKNLIHSALEKSKTCKSHEMHRLCTILYNVTPKEVNKLNLTEFLQLCFKNSEFGYIKDMFMTWCTKNDLSVCIYLALANESTSMAKYYKKFADIIHDEDETLFPQHKSTFGRIGTALMLEAFDRKYLDCALKILYILHAYNVNYYELEDEVCKFYLSRSYSDTDAFHVKIVPFLVVFAAVDICLHFERPKDAFTIFQDSSWVTPSENLDEEVKMYVFKERYHRLIKLVPLLNDQDSIHQGWEALKILLTAVEQGLVQETLEDKNQDHTEENSEEVLDCNRENSSEIQNSNKIEGKTPVQCMRSIYNDYLISLINFNELVSAYDLYVHSLGPRKDIFTVEPDVLRGLVVAFSNSGESEKAYSIFSRGIFREVYPIEAPEPSKTPWNLTIRSEWSVPEIKFAIDWFISILLSPLLAEKPKQTDYEEWFSLKIVFKVKSTFQSRITCLVETGSDPKYYINRTKDALQSMSPSLQFTEEEEALYVKSDSLYSYWRSKCCSDSPNVSNFKKPLLCQRQKRLSFGEFSVSSEKEKSPAFKEKSCFPSPENIQTHPADSIVSNYIEEIRYSTSSGTPVSPKTSPTTMHQNVQNMPANTSFIPENKFVYKGAQIDSEKLTNSIIQTNHPTRLMDMYDKESQLQREKDSLFSHNNPSISSTSKKSKIVNKSNVADVNSGIIKLKKKVVTNNTISKRKIKKKLNNSNSGKLLNSSIKNLKVSFTTDSSDRTVTSISKNDEKVSTAAKKLNLNKSKIIIQKTLNRSSLSTNITSNNSKNSEKVSPNKLQDSQALNKMSTQEDTSNVPEDSITKKSSVISRNFNNSEKVSPNKLQDSQALNKMSVQEDTSNDPKDSITKKSSPVISRNFNNSEKVSPNKLQDSQALVKTVIQKDALSSKDSTAKKLSLNKSNIVSTRKINRNLSTCIVSNNSNNSEKISPNKLQDSQALVETLIQKDALSSKDSTAKKLSLNKSNIVSTRKINRNLSTCIVSNNFNNSEKVSPNKLQDSQDLVKLSVQRTFVPNVSKDSVVKMQDLNKPNNMLRKVINRNFSNQSASNIGSNFTVNTHLKVNQIEQTQKDSVFASLEESSKAPEVPKEKISFTITQDIINSDPVVPNTVQCKVKPIIKRNFNLPYKDLQPNKKICTVMSPDKDSSTTVSSNNSVQYKEPVIRNTSPQSKLKSSNSLVSFVKKEHLNTEKFKLNQQKFVINNTRISKSSGNSCNPREFQKIIQFLKIKIAIKHKNLSPEEQNQKALTLAETFIQNNNYITKLDKTTMKMLYEFEMANV